MSLFSTNTGVAVVDTRTRQGTITLPLTGQIQNRYLQFKDLYGAFGRSSLTVSTQAGETFDDGTTSKVYTDPYTFLQLYAASTTRWAQLGGTQTIQQTTSSLIVSSITIGSGLGWLQLPPIQTVAVSTNTINADNMTINSTTSMYVSAQILYVSSIMGAVVGAGNLTTANLTSTVGGLGQIYISTGGGGGGITAANLASTVQGLGTSGYLSSVSGATGFVSSLTVNALTLGAGAGWLQLPPVQTIYSSTIYTQAQALYSLSSYFGNTSTATTLEYFGLFGNYNNTVLAEVSTGGGTQEFLVFKGSSASDRIRFQTTGNFVVETGVSARLWDDSTTRTLSNTTPAFIINTSSNVGIQTASPGATLDVAGTGRFQQVSTLGINVSSINGQTFGGPINSTVIGLGTSGYVSTLSLYSTNTGITSNYSTFISTTLATYSFPYSGQELYLNYTRTVSPYYQLGINNIIGTNASNITTVSGNTSNTFITGFQSDFFIPIFIATGLWTVSLFSQANGNNVSVYASLYQRDPVTTLEGLIATSSNSPFIVPTTKVSLDLILDVPYTNISTGNTLVLKIFANNSGSPSRNLTTFYEDGNYSHVHTTLGPGSITTNLFQSTIVGLGSFGYVSSLSNVPIVSTQQLFTSSLVGNQLQFATLSSQSLFVSSLYTATRQATPMFITF